jgi:hypothetical protein
MNKGGWGLRSVSVGVSFSFSELSHKHFYDVVRFFKKREEVSFIGIKLS